VALQHLIGYHRSVQPIPSQAQPSGGASSISQNRALIERAWALPVARLYAPLLSQGWWSICGPTSVANVLRSMGVKSSKNPLRGFGLRPMALDQVAAESKAVVPPVWRVQAARPTSVDVLRAELRHSNELNLRLIANFSRGTLFGRGGGHHSPIGGYLEHEDLAFVLDVNSSFGPWLVSSARLFEAMSTIADWTTGKTRGLVRFERS
jgi:Phytochelatin synthase